MKKRKRILLAGLVLLVAGGIATWLAIRPRDPIFRGKPESYWIEHLSYGDEEPVSQWREFGPDGVGVLVRALDGASRPGDRLYRTAYRKLGRIVPDAAMRLLPAPRMDLTRRTRMNVVQLLSRLSKDAKAATPAMARALNDEDHAVRQLAITFFTQGEDEHCLLNQMESGARKDLLPAFIRAMQDPNAGVRNNAAIALRYYSDQAQIVVPVLVKAQEDPVPKVRQLAADALKRIDPAAAAKAEAR
ncbi:MAG TPA: HEAT repeat domain-containing protein [Verrucomicrobiae bacterium]